MNFWESPTNLSSYSENLWHPKRDVWGKGYVPALAHIPPDVLRQILVEDGWTLRREDSYNWVLIKDGREPLIVPKRVRKVAFELHERCLQIAGMDLGRYFELLERVGYKH